MALALLFLISSCAKNEWDEHYGKPDFVQEGSLYEVIANNPKYSQFAGLIRKTGYDSLLRRNDVFTVLAPINGAFTGVDTSSNTPALRRIVGMHIINQLIYKDGMPNVNRITVVGKLAQFSAANPTQMVNDVKIVDFNLKAVNGLIHSIELLIPICQLSDYLLIHPM